MEFWASLVDDFKVSPSEAWGTTLHELMTLYERRTDGVNRARGKLTSHDVATMKRDLQRLQAEEQKQCMTNS